jgi:hypothetical protein
MGHANALIQSRAMARALCDFLVTCRIYCCALWGSPEICHALAIGLSVKSREDEREKTGEALVKWPGFPFFLTTSETVGEVRFDQAYGRISTCSVLHLASR